MAVGTCGAFKCLNHSQREDLSSCVEFVGKDDSKSQGENLQVPSAGLELRIYGDVCVVGGSGRKIRVVV